MQNLAQEYADAVWNTKDLSAIDRFLHHDVVIHSLLGDFQGQEKMKKVARAWLNGFPDLHIITIGVFSQGDNIALQWTGQGTHHGEFEGIAPTGRRVNYRGVSIYGFRGPKIAEYWGYIDMRHLLNQIES